MAGTLDSIYDQWLVLRAQGGEQEAYRLLADRWNHRLFRQAWTLTGRRDAAEDVLQETWLAVVRRLRTIDDPALFGPWVYAILRRKAADYIRRVQRDRRLRQTLADQSAGLPGSQAGKPQRNEDITSILKPLSPDHRSVLVMYYLESMAVSEIALFLSIPEGTVKSRLHHARREVRNAFERNEP